ncbi:MAG: phosphonate ABC transporter, permease protein PhnE [Spirochaetes bacterium]|jgi:phosphonate transport system permease protein|nr:phosphonate ABC transporter, permease protein PhnE [Spirochaetota bacterium]
MSNAATKTNAPSRSLVSPWLAAVISAVIPGVGQLFARQVQRGLLIFAAFGTAVVIYWWRIVEIARREELFGERVSKAFDLETSFFILVLLFLVLLWLANIFDALLAARSGKQRRSGVFLAVLGTFFVLGWQISEIDVGKMIREAPDALPPLSRVLWPWEAAITYETASVSAYVPILVSDEEEIPPMPEREPGEPYLTSDRRKGELSRQDEQGNIIAGTELTLEGENFKPNTQTQIWWRDPIGNEFRIRQEGEYVTVMTDDQGSFEIDVTMPYRIVPPSARGAQIHRVEARQTSETGPPLPSEPLRLTIGRMVETIFMGMMATFFGIIFSVPISFLAARNIMGASALTMAIYYVTRTILNIIRSIEPLIWALIAVVWVGLGPFAGIVALTLHSIAALGKLYSEAIEGIDHGPIEAIQATGANWLQTIVFAVIPQMISPFISFSIYRWDINVRMSTVIGLVGGGGIGFLLVQYIRLLDYRSAGIAVWFIAITVAVLDYVSAEIRAKLT